MIEGVLILIAALSVGAGAGSAAFVLLRDRRGRTVADLVKRSVVVQTDNGQTTQGVLEAASRDCLILSHARHLEGASDVELSGEVLIPRSRIWRVEVPTAETLAGVER